MLDMQEPKVIRLIQKAERKMRATGKLLGTVTRPGKSVNWTFERGYHMVIAGGDARLLQRAGRNPGQGIPRLAAQEAAVGRERPPHATGAGRRALKQRGSAPPRPACRSRAARPLSTRWNQVGEHGPRRRRAEAEGRAPGSGAPRLPEWSKRLRRRRTVSPFPAGAGARAACRRSAAASGSAARAWASRSSSSRALSLSSEAM